MKRLTASSRPQLILMIGDEGALIVPHKIPGEPEAFFVAEKNERGIDAVTDVLNRNPRAPLTLFADTLAQDFRLETLPRLNPLDRPKLIERRLRQAFPQAGLAASLNSRRNRTQVLLVALHGDGPVPDWLERLKALCRGRLPHIALLPVECADILTHLLPNASHGWAMLLSRQRTGGFRQIVTHDGELIFTRLTPPLPSSARMGEIAEAVARDIKASLGYLGRLSLTNPTELRVVMLMPESMHAALKLLALPVHSLRLLTPHHAALELGLPQHPETEEIYSDLLYAEWLAQKRKPRLPLMPPDMKRTRRTETIKQWGWRTAVVALLATFVTTGLQAGDLFSTLIKMRQETAQLAELKQQLTQEQATAAPVTQPLGRLRQAIERRRIFSERTAVPWATLQMLGAGLGGEARLVKFDWHNEAGKPDDETMQIDVRFLQNPSAPNEDRQAIVARFQKLVQGVTHAMPGYDVKLTRYPFPALPEEALSNEKDAKTSDDTAEITVRRVVP